MTRITRLRTRMEIDVEIVLSEPLDVDDVNSDESVERLYDIAEDTVNDLYPAPLSLHAGNRQVDVNDARLSDDVDPIFEARE